MTNFPKTRFLDSKTPPHIVTLVLLVGVAALSMSVFLPSLKAMAEHFDTSYAVMQISVSGYLAGTALLQIIIGPIADRYGRRPVLLVSIAIFCLATVGTILAPTITVFLVFRILQGIIATGMVLGRAVVRDIVPQDQAASMIGYVTMGMALVPMVGPMIGGGLDELFDWRAAFMFLLLCGLGVFWLVWRDLGETVRGGGMSFADQIRTYPELLSSPRFWGYALCAAFGSGAFFAFLGGSSFVADTVFGLSPFWAGFAFGAPAIGYAAGNYLSGRYSVRFGINTMILSGTIITLLGLGLSLGLAVIGLSTPTLFFGFCTFLGLGNGMMLPNATAGLLSVRPHLAGGASGLGSAMMVGGGALLSALAGLVLTGEAGTIPLQAIMFGTTFCSLLSILFVLRRERRLERPALQS
ncbi:multidrug effflux MFS transporter [Aestuariibius insulae]|uniref:multidrug effflux MFS transporter n=1 Tax=Aestuariibius insulae TaxID=2058287 RepID=UPI00345EF7F7